MRGWTCWPHCARQHANKSRGSSVDKQEIRVPSSVLRTWWQIHTDECAEDILKAEMLSKGQFALYP